MRVSIPFSFCHLVTLKCALHIGYTCQDFQALPIYEKDPDDFQVIALGGVNGWRRCRQCHTMIELERGCYHMVRICLACREWGLEAEE